MHRIGPLGFLGTADKAAGGNQGLLDQVMVLNWVKENIAKFGGDPDKVTIFGEDSGAASVTLMAMSEKAKGLFHGAIALSGNALCDQYLQNEPQEASRELATRLECTTDTGADIINCLRRKSQQEIISSAQQMFVSSTIIVERILHLNIFRCSGHSPGGSRPVLTGTC